MPTVDIIDGPAEGEKFTARTFMDYMRKSSSHWWKEGQASTTCDWVFRGHWDESWKLVPTAARPNLERFPNFRLLVGNVRDEMRCNDDWEKLDENSQDQLARKWAHMLCTTHFIELARSLNIIDYDIPDLTTRVLTSWIARNHMHTEITSINSAGQGGFPKETDPSIALAQHYSIPTFLLDWTEDPLTACYFASNRPKDIDVSHGAAIWCLNIRQLKQDDEDMQKLIHHKIREKMAIAHIGVSSPAKKGNSYLSSQSGVLTYLKWGVDAHWKELGEYPSYDWGLKNISLSRFDEVYDERDFKIMPHTWPTLLPDGIEKARDWLSRREPVLKKIVLSANEIPDLQQLLLREGISKAHLMPSLDNVASTAMASLIR